MPRLLLSSSYRGRTGRVACQEKGPRGVWSGLCGKLRGETCGGSALARRDAPATCGLGWSKYYLKGVLHIAAGTGGFDAGWGDLCQMFAIWFCANWTSVPLPLRMSVGDDGRTRRSLRISFVQTEGTLRAIAAVLRIPLGQNGVPGVVIAAGTRERAKVGTLPCPCSYSEGPPFRSVSARSTGCSPESQGRRSAS